MKISAIAFLTTAVGLATAQNGTEPFAADFSPIVEKGSYTSLLGAINETGSDAVISSNAPVTIFGPWDEAFDNITDVLETLTTEDIQGVLLNHVIVGVNLTTEMIAAEGCIEATTAGGLEISIFRDPFTGLIDVDGFHVVVDPDITGDYGVMHGIDRVILAEEHVFFPCPPPLDLSPIAQLGNYSTLLALLEQTNNDFAISIALSNSTIFGPSDTAFAAIQSTLDELNDDQLNEVLWGHLAYGEVFSNEVRAFGCVEVETFAGTSVAVRFNDTTGIASVNGIPISSTNFDIAGEGYVFHGIEGVLADSEYVPCDPLDLSLVELAGNYSTFLSLVAQTGLANELNDFIPVTIFGPSDAAFAAIQSTLDELNNDEIREVLLGHLAFGEIFYDEVRAFECAEAITFGGTFLAVRVNRTTGTASVNGIPISSTNFDIDGEGYVFHGIEGVLADSEYVSCSANPLDLSLVELAGNYSTFLSLVAQTGLVDELNNFTPVTIFGPSDAAFAAIQSTLDELNNDEIREVLLGHLAFGEIFYDEVRAFECAEAITFGGTFLAVRVNRTTGTASVNGIPISSTNFDIDGEGYVFHGIEGVLVDSEYVPCSADPLDFSSVELAGNYSTLLSLVAQTGLVDELNEVRPVTILAPTDAAFARYQSNLTGLSDEEIAEILRIHVIAFDTIDAQWILDSECMEFFTEGGSMVSFRYDNVTEQITVNGIPLVQADILGNFGVLHGIDGNFAFDGQYEPCFEDPYSVVGYLTSYYDQQVTEAAVAAFASSATFFGPTDEAFYSLDEYPFYSDDAAEREVELLLGHIVPGIHTAAQVKEAGCVILDTLAGTKVRVMWVEGDMGGRRLAGHEMTGMVMVNDAMVILADQLDEESDVMFHGIDKVILSGSFSECPSTMSPVTAPTDAPAPRGTPPTESSAAFFNHVSIIFASMFALLAL
ncbi:unnamed protein product [Cylindrotheca closterium]|uniref:FAS1 domain-containing protein n=1 Tax=Cylindrotheca closterium TaxID=2856 RepID=A0AAD2CK92_9STRA|nr:unnamed protein product [Cylindrotheca closterium]